MKNPVRYDYVFLLPVWGESYTKHFLEVCLPFLMTDGNFGFFSARGDAGLIILADFETRKLLLNSEIYPKLSNLIDVKIIVIDGCIDFVTSHRAMTDCYIIGMRDEWVEPTRSNLIFLTPDSIWSDGTFRNLVAEAESGKRCVMVIGLRTDLVRMTNYLQMQILKSPEDLSIPNRELTSAALKNLHGMALAHNWLSKSFINGWPSNVYWCVTQHLMIAHAFHMHPLMVRASSRKMSVRDSVDGSFVSQQKIRPSSITVVTDSDFILGVEMTAGERDWEVELDRPSLAALKRFSYFFASPMHWSFFFNRVYFKGIDDSTIPDDVLRNIDRVIAEMQKFVRARPYLRWNTFHSLINVSLSVRQSARRLVSLMRRTIRRR